MKKALQALTDFVRYHCGNRCALQALPSDASHRRYFRIEGTSNDMLAMSAPFPQEDLVAFLRVAAYLGGLGLRVPKVYAYDIAQGFALIEDLGSQQTYTRCLNAGAERLKLYEQAIDSLVLLHQRSRGDSNASFLPFYDLDALEDEHRLLLDWYVPSQGVSLSTAAQDDYCQRWRELLESVLAAQKDHNEWVVVLRDYHVDNLIHCPQSVSPRACGLLDFQDARLGSRAYDLVSLLYDVRMTLKQDEIDHLFQYYGTSYEDYGETDKEQFARGCAILNAQRLCKIIGIFVRLDKRDGKEAYRTYMPRVRVLLRDALQTKPLAPIRAWFDEHGVTLEA